MAGWPSGVSGIDSGMYVFFLRGLYPNLDTCNFQLKLWRWIDFNNICECFCHQLLA